MAMPLTDDGWSIGFGTYAKGSGTGKGVLQSADRVKRAESMKDSRMFHVQFTEIDVSLRLSALTTNGECSEDVSAMPDGSSLAYAPCVCCYTSVGLVDSVAEYNHSADSDVLQCQRTPRQQAKRDRVL
jgi:hypothetical protein